MTNLEKLEPFSSDIIGKYLAGVGTAKLGKEYGVNPSFIWQLLQNNGVETRKLSPIRGKALEIYGSKIKELYELGLPLAQIVSELGVNYNLVTRLEKQLGINIPRVGYYRPDFHLDE